MKTNAKSSVTLPADELALVNELKARLGAKSKVEVVRRGLWLLRDSTDREALRQAYAKASLKTRESTLNEVEDWDALSDEGLGDDDHADQDHADEGGKAQGDA